MGARTTIILVCGVICFLIGVLAVTIPYLGYPWLKHSAGLQVLGVVGIVVGVFISIYFLSNRTRNRGPKTTSGFKQKPEHSGATSPYYPGKENLAGPQHERSKFHTSNEVANSFDEQPKKIPFMQLSKFSKDNYDPSKSNTSNNILQLSSNTQPPPPYLEENMRIGYEDKDHTRARQPTSCIPSLIMSAPNNARNSREVLLNPVRLPGCSKTRHNPTSAKSVGSLHSVHDSDISFLSTISTGTNHSTGSSIKHLRSSMKRPRNADKDSIISKQNIVNIGPDSVHSVKSSVQRRTRGFSDIFSVLNKKTKRNRKTQKNHNLSVQRRGISQHINPTIVLEVKGYENLAGPQYEGNEEEPMKENQLETKEEHAGNFSTISSYPADNNYLIKGQESKSYTVDAKQNLQTHKTDNLYTTYSKHKQTKTVETTVPEQRCVEHPRKTSRNSDLKCKENGSKSKYENYNKQKGAHTMFIWKNKKRTKHKPDIYPNQNNFGINNPPCHLFDEGEASKPNHIGCNANTRLNSEQENPQISTMSPLFYQQPQTEKSYPEFYSPNDSNQNYQTDYQFNENPLTKQDQLSQRNLDLIKDAKQVNIRQKLRNTFSVTEISSLKSKHSEPMHETTSAGESKQIDMKVSCQMTEEDQKDTKNFSGECSVEEDISVLAANNERIEKKLKLKVKSSDILKYFPKGKQKRKLKDRKSCSIQRKHSFEKSPQTHRYTNLYGTLPARKTNKGTPKENLSLPIESPTRTSYLKNIEHINNNLKAIVGDKKLVIVQPNIKSVSNAQINQELDILAVVNLYPGGNINNPKLGYHVGGSVESLNSVKDSVLSFGSTGSYNSAGSITSPLRSSLKKPKNKFSSNSIVSTASGMSSSSGRKSVRIAMGGEQTTV